MFEAAKRRAKAAGARVGFAATLATCATACSSAGSDSFDSSGAATDAEGDTAAASGGGGTTGDGSATDDDQSPSGTDTTTGPDTSTTGPLDTGTPDPTCQLDCGDDAFCQDDGSGPQCMCFDPQAQWGGSECLPCTRATGTSYALDVPVVDATFRVSLDGGPFPQSLTETGRLVLRSRDSVDAVELGPTGAEDYTATVVVGVYDVYYEFERGGSQIPLNRSAKLDTIFVDDSEVIDLDVPRTLVSAQITLNAGEPPDSQSNWGRIALVERSTGDEVPVGATNDPNRNLYVVPGTYDVHYRWRDGLNSVPRNADAILAEIEIPETQEPFALHVDIPMQEITGSIFVNDVMAPDSLTEHGALTLVNDDDPDDTIDLADTSEQNYSAKIIPGSYSVYYSFRSGGSTVPANSWGFVQSLGDGSDIRIGAVQVTGGITIGGQAPPADGSNDGTLSLRTPGGDHIILGNTRDGTYSRNVMPGTYDVFYSQETASGLVPVNTNARVQPLTVTAGGVGDTIDVEMVQLTGTISLNSQLPPDSEYDDGRVYLRNRETGDSVLLGNTRMGAFDKPVVPATYDLVYVVEAAGDDVPVNTEALILPGVDITATDSLPVNIIVDRLAGEIQIGGASPMAAGATVVLQDVLTGDEVFVGTLDDPAFDQVLTVGRYLARYRGGPDSYNGPENTDAAFACIEITAPQP